MNRRLFPGSRALGCLLWLAACSADTEVDDASDHRALDVNGAPVQVLDYDSWIVTLGCSAGCVWTESFWVDVAIRNDSYHKSVGVLWTDDGWETVHDTALSYEVPLEGSFERWGADIELGTFSTGPFSNPRPEEVEFAAYAEMNGQTYWDPDGNRYIYGRVDEDNPVHVLDSEVFYDPNAGGTLAGRIRVFDIDYDKQVTVRYTTDGWASWQDTEASWEHGDDWSFSIGGLGMDVLPDEVQFALRYRSGGEEHWDNNGGQNYRHTMEPQITPSGYYQTYELEDVLSGLITLGSRVSTDMPIDVVQTRIDDDMFADGGSATFTTLDMADGPHTVTFRVTLEGGYQSGLEADFAVENRISPLETWVPDYGADAGGSAWGMAARDGRVFVYWEGPYAAGTTFRGVVRFPAFGEDSPTVYEALPVDDNGFADRLAEITVDDQGRVYGVTNSDPGIYRWTADGQLDDTFGAQGLVELDVNAIPDYPLTAVYGAGALNVLGRCFGLSCPDSLYRFDADGQLLDVSLLPDETGSFDSGAREAGAMTYDGETLWLLRGRSLLGLEPGAAGWVASETIEFAAGFAINGIDELVRTEDGTFFAIEGAGNRLVAIAPSGEILGTWYSRANVEQLDVYAGAVHVSSGMAILPDGNVGVLDAHDGRIASFASQLIAP